MQDAHHEGKNTGKSASSSYPKGAGDRVSQSALVIEQHEVFQGAIGGVRGSTVREGCLLAFLARQVREYYSDKDKRSNNITSSLIGEQAISLARYSFRLIHALQIEEEEVWSSEDQAPCPW